MLTMHPTPEQLARQHAEHLQLRLEERFPDLIVRTGVFDYADKIWCEAEDSESGRLVLGRSEFAVDDQTPEERAQMVLGELENRLE